MAELHIHWATGEREIREVYFSGGVVTVGDSRQPLVATVPIGKSLVMGGNRIPWLRVRVHGNELPEMRLLTRDARTLPRETRRRAAGSIASARGAIDAGGGDAIEDTAALYDGDTP